LKNIQNISQYTQLIQSTEAECIKYLKNTNVFEMIRMNDIENIKKMDYINFREINDEGNTVLHYAIDVGDTGILKELLKKGGMIDTVNGNGNTLLEYACLQQDPNMINFLGKYGANMQKHLYFRDGPNKYITHNDSIDINILLKFILSYECDPIDKNNIYNKIKFIKNNFDLNEKININIHDKEHTYNDLFNGLSLILNKLPENAALTYLNIISEELNYVLNNKLGCPPNKLEIILVNLVPFINYPFNITIDWVLSLELKYLILKLIKKKINSINIKKELIEYIWKNYIEPEIIQEDYLGCLISQWIAKIKV
jgi:hypothetical protein